MIFGVSNGNFAGLYYPHLQHFATKLRNITNFVMLFQAVMTFLSGLVQIKILFIREQVHTASNFRFTYLAARLVRLATHTVLFGV